MVGFHHPFHTDFTHILHRLFSRAGNDAVGLLDVNAMQREQRRLHRRPRRRRQLQRAACLGPVANHPRQITEQILDRPGNMLQIPAHQVRNPRRRARPRRHRTPAHRRQSPRMSLDIPGHHMAQRHGLDHIFFVRGFEILTDRPHRQNRRQPVIAAAGRAHRRQLRPRHPRIAGRRGQHPRRQNHILADQPLPRQPVQHLAHSHPAAVGHPVLGQLQIAGNPLPHEIIILLIHLLNQYEQLIK